MPRPLQSRGKTLVDVSITPADTLLFRSPITGVGEFVCAPHHPEFARSGPVASDLMVFARRDVRIASTGRRSFVNSSNVVAFYARGEEIRRMRVDPAGVHSTWFALENELLAECAGRDGTLSLDPAPVDASTFLRHDRLVAHLRAGGWSDPLAVEENVLDLVRRAIRAADEHVLTSGSHSRAAVALVERAKEAIGSAFDRPLSLKEVARAIGCSPFHLSRTFRRVAGIRLYEYRNHLRLRRSLELVREPEADLLTVALGLGYSSHSHFTAAFRAAFGVTPSAMRRPRGGRGSSRRGAAIPDSAKARHS